MAASPCESKNNQNNRINHTVFKKSKIEEVDIPLNKVLKSICKIKIYDVNGEYKIGTGFLLKFLKEEKLFYCLMTNEHVINKEIIESNIEIEVFYDFEEKQINIDLKWWERFIKCYKNYDIAIVEILKEDNIEEKYFLSPDLDYNNLNDKKIYIPQYPNGEKLSYARGKILEIDKIKKYEIAHNASTISGSSGSPIFLEGTNKVIGIHKQGTKNKTKNFGSFIYPIINLLNNNIFYNPEQYEGSYVNNKFEGFGKYFYDTGEHYEGEWKNGLRNGKGKLYDEKNHIKYDGDWIDDKKEGYGIYIWDNGERFEGEWKNDLRNGKGVDYYKNGDKYEGNWVNNKREGVGKYIYKNGDYYFGEYKKHFANGKGTEFYKNGKIKYEGDFVNDKYEGNGKQVYENDDYYIGEFKNNKKNGKGKYYYKNGEIKCEGIWVNDDFREDINKK